MLTIQNTKCRTLTKDLVDVGGHEIRVEWREDVGPVINQGDLRAVCDAGHANWSKEEIDQLAIHCEDLLIQVFGNESEIA